MEVRPRDRRRDSAGSTDSTGRLSRRRLLGTAASLSVTSSIAGCMNPFGGNDGPKASVFLSALIPTVAVKTSSGEWIPRPIKTDLEEPGWEIALQTGDRYNPAQDKRPDWADTWIPENKIDNQNTYFKIPGQLVVHSKGVNEANAYPKNTEIEPTSNIGSALRYFATEGRLTIHSDDSDRIPHKGKFAQLLEVEESKIPGREARAGHVSSMELSTHISKDTTFYHDVQGHSNWNGETARIGTRTANDYAANVTIAEEFAEALADGWKELVKFQKTVISTFSTATSLVTNALIPTLTKMALKKIVLKGSKGARQEALAAISEIVNDGKSLRPSRNIGSDKLKSAQSMTGSIFFPPVTEKMKNKIDIGDLSVKTRAPGVEVVDVGIGFSGPMLYIVDRTDRHPTTTAGTATSTSTSPPTATPTRTGTAASIAGLFEGFEDRDTTEYRSDADNTGPSTFTTTTDSEQAFDAPQGDTVGQISVENTQDGWWADVTDFGATIEPGDRIVYYARNTAERGAIELVYWRNTADTITKGIYLQLRFEDQELRWRQRSSSDPNLASTDQRLLANVWYRVEIDIGENGTTHTASVYKRDEQTPLASLSVQHDEAPANGIELRYGWNDLTAEGFFDGLAVTSEQ